MQPHIQGAPATDAGESQTPAAIPLWDGGVSVGSHLLSRSAVSCLSFLSSHPQSSGTDVRRGIGVRHLSQISRLLVRLEARGLVFNDPHARENAWSLTEYGREVLNEARPVWAEQIRLAEAGQAGSPPASDRAGAPRRREVPSVSPMPSIPA
jgi:DNA-binding MarR family transcriptional regulator